MYVYIPTCVHRCCCQTIAVDASIDSAVAGATTTSVDCMGDGDDDDDVVDVGEGNGDEDGN
jgi:hypothetical protein